MPLTEIGFFKVRLTRCAPVKLTHYKEAIMKTPTLHAQLTSLTTSLLTLAVLAVITACSPKPDVADDAMKTKAIVDQAVAETKKQMLDEQAADKAKQEASVIAQAADKAKQEAAVAEAKKQLLAEQRATAKPKSHKSSPVTAGAAPTSVASTDTAETSSELPSTLLTSPVILPGTSPARKKIVCATCGTVVSIAEVETEGKGSVLGVGAGAVVGGLLGNQVGSGKGRDLATIAGAIGGAVAGNKIEKKMKKTKSYNITVKMETGEEAVFHQDAAPNFAKGDAVKIDNNVVVKK